MKFFLSIGEIDKNIIFPILGGVLKCIIRIILNYSILLDHPLILSLYSSLGMSLSFILLIIYYYKNKNTENTNNNSSKIKKKDNDKNKSSRFELVYNDLFKIISHDKYKFIFLTSLMDFILTILICNFCINIKINMWICDIIFMSLFSYYFFQIKIYKHHIISIIIIFITGFILDIITGHYDYILDEIIPIIIKFFGEIIFSFSIIINKYTMEKKFSSPYEICFYQGIITLVLYSIFSIFSNIFNFLDNFSDYKKNFDLQELFISIVVIIIQFAHNLFILITIRNYTSCHIMIIIVIGELAPHILKLVHEENISIIIIIGLIFILFMTLIFNEIIEVNCFGLNKNTKKNIGKRAIEEGLTMVETDRNDRFTEESLINYIEEEKELETNTLDEGDKE